MRELDLHIRPVADDEQPLLRRFLLIAARMEGTDEPVDRVDTNPELLRYHDGWGRPGDFGLVACDGAPDGEALACVWGRLRDGGRDGFVAPDVPVLAMGTVAEVRGRGVGERLLLAYIDACRERWPAVSLSVRRENPAVRLYRRVGFVEVPGAEHENRHGDVSLTMVKRWG